MAYRISEEHKFSEWALGVKGSDQTVFETYRWIGMVLKGKDAKYREINWLAARLPELREGGILSAIEMEKVGAMLGCGSITLEEGAKEMMCIAHPRQGEAVRKLLLDVIAHGRKDAVRDAIDALLGTGDASCICAAAGKLAQFGKNERKRIVRRMESLARENPGGLDFAGLRERLVEAGAELRRKEPGAPEEMRRHFLSIRKAAREAALEEKKKIADKRGGNGQGRPLRKAASY